MGSYSYCVLLCLCTSLFVQTLPTGSGRPRTTATAGESVVLECHTSGSSPVRWIRNPSLSELYPRPRVIYAYGKMAKDFASRLSVDTTSKGSFHLTITDVDEGDSGVYVCEEVEGRRLRVERELHVITSKSHKGVRLVVAVVGESIDLDCKTVPGDWFQVRSAGQKPRLVSDSDGITAGFRKRFQLDNSARRTTLKIHNVQFEDAGIYQCSSVVKYKQTQQTRLIVYGRSTQVQRRVAFEGKGLSLHCRTSSATDVGWRLFRHGAGPFSVGDDVCGTDGKVDRKFQTEFSIDSTTGNLVVKNVEQKQAGVYECFDVSRADETKLTVFHVDVYDSWSNLRTVFGQEDKTAELRCNGVLDWPYEWTFAGRLADGFQTIPSDDSRYVVVDDKDGDYVLRIHDLESDDAGFYVCRQHGDTGSRKTLIRLFILGESRSIDTHLAFRGADVEIPCDLADSDQSDVVWKFESYSSISSRKVGERSLDDRLRARQVTWQSPGSVYALHVGDVDLWDAGLYICTQNGRVVQTATLDVYENEWQGDRERHCLGSDLILSYDDKNEHTSLFTVWQTTRRPNGGVTRELTAGVRADCIFTDCCWIFVAPEHVVEDAMVAYVDINLSRPNVRSTYVTVRHCGLTGDRNLTRADGETAVLFYEIRCGPDVYCYYQAGHTSPASPIYVHGEVSGPHRDRVGSSYNDGGQNFSLWIVNVNLMDSGVYTCVEDTGMQRQYRVQLDVTHSRSTSATVGEEVHFECPLPTTDATTNWYYHSERYSPALLLYANGQVTTMYRGRATTRLGVRGQSVLVVDEVGFKDRGFYTCATSDGRRHHTLLLHVSQESACYELPKNERRDCGFWGVTREHCEQNNCCYDDSQPDSYNCFLKPFGCADVPKDRRIDCGHFGITKDECINKGCCYDSSVSDAPHCFQKPKGFKHSTL